MKIYLLILSFFLTGCLDLILYRESHAIDRMAHWEKRQKNLGSAMHENINCSNKAEKTMQEKLKIKPTYKNREIYYKYFGECMYEKGYIFKTTNWLYCYHRKEECEAYSEYRK